MQEKLLNKFTGFLNIELKLKSEVCEYMYLYVYEIQIRMQTDQIKSQNNIRVIKS